MLLMSLSVLFLVAFFVFTFVNLLVFGSTLLRGGGGASRIPSRKQEVDRRQIAGSRINFGAIPLPCGLLPWTRENLSHA